MSVVACLHDSVRLLNGGERWCRLCGAIGDGSGVWEIPVERGDLVLAVELPKLPDKRVATVRISIQSDDIGSAFAWLERLQRHRMATLAPTNAVMIETDW